MQITILAIGKKHDPKLISAVEDYTKRLNHYTKASWQLIEGKITSNMTENEIREHESNLLLGSTHASTIIILLDEIGQQQNSVQFSQRLQVYMNQGIKHVTFIIGGAYGVSNELKQRADFVLSLSEMVFPHQLVRLILIEQLYRAHTILANEKYHHA